MAIRDRRFRRVSTATIAALVLVSACSPSPSTSPAPATAEPSSLATVPVTPDATDSGAGAPTPGGTIRLLSWYEEMNQIDPQRIYTAEDLAFFGATTQRSLTWYAPSPDPTTGTTLVPDMATDLGTATDGGRTWSFTLRDGVTWQDGSPVTCEDLKYGVSRTFANDIINQGPTYSIAYLDIPPNPLLDKVNDPRSAFLSAYYGPYDKTGQDLFDRAVECSPDDRTITFHLKLPVGDFNSTVSLGFSPVPNPADHPGVDSGETYGQPGHLAWSTGPYLVDSYTTGQTGKLVLVRNASWKPASDPIRHAYPDRWEIDFGVPEADIDLRLITSGGDNAFSVDYLGMEPENVSRVFDAPGLAKPEFSARAMSGYDLYTRYYWIDPTKVPNIKVRQAMLVALDRAGIRDAMGGAFVGDFADGVIQPTLGRDYANTGIWTTFFGEAIPDSGDPELAKRLIAESGETPPTLKFKIPTSPRNEQVLKVVIASLGRAGLTVEWDPGCEGYCAAVFQNTQHFGVAGWGADWPSASTVIPPLFTKAGGWDLSNVDDPAFNAAVVDAQTTLDRDAQALKWQALNRQVVENAWVIPTFYTRTQRIAGTGIGGAYLWPAYSSWSYTEMYVKR